MRERADEPRNVWYLREPKTGEDEDGLRLHGVRIHSIDLPACLYRIPAALLPCGKPSDTLTTDMFYSRLRCHFCGARSSHAKTVREFQCSACEALNFFDGKGNVIDTPETVAAQSGYADPATKAHLAPASALHRSSNHPQNPIFCRSCVQNQLLYTQALANYLPDEDHPRYRHFEATLPQYKADLEKRYPQICKKCAPLAQATINRADYYSKTQLISRPASARRSQQGQPRSRDSWGKKCSRILLNIAGSASLAGLTAQCLFHLYGMLGNILEPLELQNGDSDLPNDKAVRLCAARVASLHFDEACLGLFSSFIPYTIILSASLLWYNPGLKTWYHHTIRVEAIKGQKDYFLMQVLIIMIRCFAWFTLSDHATRAKFDSRQLAALHAVAALVPCAFQLVGTRVVEPVPWKLKGNIMPRPEDRDVLGAFAGPEAEQHVSKASEKDPWRYLKRQENEPFNIARLAPQASTTSSEPGHPWAEAQFPSPADTEESDAGDEDAMETDYQPVMRSSFTSQSQAPNVQLRPRGFRTVPQNAGWSNMRGEIFDMQDQMRDQEARRIRDQQLATHGYAVQSTPFRGKLPPAPMSVERRLRNPVSQPAQPPKVPLSQQQDFFAQMSTGIKPVAFPEQNHSGLELRRSAWTLPGDIRETGLEDLMSGSSFRIDDESATGPAAKTFGWFSSILNRNGS